MKSFVTKLFLTILSLAYMPLSLASVVYISSPTAINPNTVSRSVPNGVIYNPNVVVDPFQLKMVSPYGRPDTAPPDINSNDTEDYVIASNVQSQIAQNGSFGGSSITVICQKGIVTLLGTVTQLSVASRAIKIASEVPGVKGVNSKLSVYNGTGYQ